MNILEHAVALSSEEYPVGSISLGLPVKKIGVWKKMDGVENFHPGSGVNWCQFPSSPKPIPYFERVA